MKIGSTQGFGAKFTPESTVYLSEVRKQAQKSGRMNEYESAKKAITYNFSQGIITKELSYPDRDIFSFTPNQAIRYTFKTKENDTKELDSFIKLSKEIRKISM